MGMQRDAIVLAGGGTRRWLLHALGGSAVTFAIALGAAVAATTAPPLAIFLAFLACLCAMYPAAVLVAARQRSELRLSEEGFTIAGPLDQFIPWTAVERFVVMERGAARLVAFDAALGSDLAGLRWVRRFAGHDGALMESYGKDPYELAALLEAWRRAALRRAHGSNS